MKGAGPLEFWILPSSGAIGMVTGAGPFAFGFCFTSLVLMTSYSITGWSFYPERIDKGCLLSHMTVLIAERSKARWNRSYRAASYKTKISSLPLADQIKLGNKGRCQEKRGTFNRLSNAVQIPPLLVQKIRLPIVKRYKKLSEFTGVSKEIHTYSLPCNSDKEKLMEK